MVKKKIVQLNKKDYEKTKAEVYSEYTANKVTEEYDIDSYNKYLASIGVSTYDIEGLTNAYIKGKLDIDEYHAIKDAWTKNKPIDLSMVK